MSWGEFGTEYPLLCSRLQQAKRQGRTGQAYLLMGDDAEYLESFAMRWVEVAACLEPQEDGSPCGHCHSCQTLSRGAYPELLIVRPQSKSRQITVESMREFERNLSMTSSGGLLKVGIIVEAECMNDDSQNAFLKTLEEPPRGTMLLLLTVNSRKLLPTIRSRCQTLSLLRNRIEYKVALKKDLYTKLKGLKRQAGAAVGLKISTALYGMFSELHKDAEAMADDLKDHRWDTVDDPKIKKQLEEDLTARIESEYVRMRERLLGGIQAWHLQRFLISCGVRRENLPQQEIVPFEEELFASPVDADEAERDIQLAEELSACISGNVDERLALDSFCLNVTEKTAAMLRR